MELSSAEQSGRWSDIGAGSERRVSLPVLSLWLDHGGGCRDGAYEYVVLPGMSAAETARWAEHPTIEVLANTPVLQAAYSRPEQLVAAAFWSPGALVTPLGTLGVDQPCLLLARATHDGGLELTLANPLNEPGRVTVSVDGQTQRVTLPDGGAAGSSVMLALQRPRRLVP